LHPTRSARAPEAATPPAPICLLGLDRAGLEGWLAGLGQARFRAAQLLQWIHQRGEADFARMTNLSRALRDDLAQCATVTPPRVLADRISADGTRKWVLGLPDGNAIETVYIPEPRRGTLCVSSQVGCQLNCSFCATARQGWNRNLTTAEIVGQVWLASRRVPIPEGRERAITNVVFMGMGEPMLNLDAAIPALRLLQDDLAYGLSWRRVTVSTAGVIPGIERLRDEAVPCSLALSLHAPDDALRDVLVPLNRRYPIAPLLDACRRFLARDERRRVTIEYALLAGVNDSPAQARALAKLLQGLPCKINLLPFNPFPGAPYRRPEPDAVAAFREALIARGHVATVRRTRGEDIAGACGQLVGEVRPRTRRVAEVLA
jgi:23S rRNA (adenine2503-C2)-methyltransferase